jgi:hypothetical protein
LALVPTHPTLTSLVKDELATLIAVNRKRSGLAVNLDIRLTDAETLHGLAVSFLIRAQTVSTAGALHATVPDLSPELVQGGAQLLDVVADVLRADQTRLDEAIRLVVSKRLLLPALTAFNHEGFCSRFVDAVFHSCMDLPQAEALREYGHELEARVTQLIANSAGEFNFLGKQEREALVLPILLSADLIRDGKG